MKGSQNLCPESRRLLAVSFLLLLAVLIGGCRADKEVKLVADGQERTLRTKAATVRDVLKEAGITLRDLDRTEPDLWVEIEPGLTVSVLRVEESFEVITETIPFGRKVLKNEALPEGERKLIQPGRLGEVEITYRKVLENGQEKERKAIQRRTVREPLDEVIVVGVEGTLPSVTISGTIAYISAGNAWVMRGASGGRRPLTSEGDLDQRVFALSPDGKRLIFSRGLAAEPPTPLNSLWIIDTTIVGEEARPLGIEEVIYGEWAPDGKRFAYSTAERTGGAPGWKAHNDLWIAAISENTASQVITLSVTQILSPTTAGPYSWWGTNYSWSPDGKSLAYATAEEIGLVELSKAERKPLVKFPVYYTYGEWVWVPTLSWSPDGRFLLSVVHSAPDEEESFPEDSPLFDVMAIEVNGDFQAPLVRESGMWAAPLWSPAREETSRIVYGQAQTPRSSASCLYDLYIMDRDGSNKARLFPTGDEPGLTITQVAWSPEGDKLVFVYEDNLYLLDLKGGRPLQLTSDGFSSQPRWAK
ncbi:MAG: G5 domain-containing protein [Anaerolineae bacterium]